MLKLFLTDFFAKRFYPTNQKNWYKLKKYKGKTHQEVFDDFLLSQRKEGSLFYNEFKDLFIKRQYIESPSGKLDSVLITPDKKQSSGKPGENLYFIMFSGSREYYESRFRDMAIQSKETGASILGFNPKGLHSSTGKTKKISDLVDDGISAIEFLLQMGVKHEQIILQGNSLGAGVQEMVDQYYRKNYKKRFRQINSNSFNDISSVLAVRYNLFGAINIIRAILKYSNWEIYPGQDFWSNGPYRCHMRRQNDRTILPRAEYHINVNFAKDHKNCPKNYRKSHKWLHENCQLTYEGKSKKDPHYMSLHQLSIKEQNSGKILSAYDFINYYLIHSKPFIYSRLP